jgi:hypothetical protein
MLDSSPHRVLKNKIRKDEKILRVFMLDPDYVWENPLRSVPNLIMIIVGLFACAAIIFSIDNPTNKPFHATAVIFYSISMTLNFFLGLGLIAVRTFRRVNKGNFEYDYSKKPKVKPKTVFQTNDSSYSLRVFGVMSGLATFLACSNSHLLINKLDYLVSSIIIFIFCLLSIAYSMSKRKSEQLAVAITNKRVLYMDAKRLTYHFVELNHRVKVWKDYQRHTIHLEPYMNYTEPAPSNIDIRAEAQKYKKGDQVGMLTIRGLEDDEYLLYLITKVNKDLCKY